MLLGINPGILGQGVWEPIYEKVSMLRDYLNSHGRPDIDIQVDGSVKKDNSAKLIKSGFNVLVCGSSTIFRPEDGPLAQTIVDYRSSVNENLEKYNAI